jgi:hypothetical protein
VLESLPEQLARRLEQCALWVKRRASLPRGERGSEATAVRVEQREIVVEIVQQRIRLLGALVPDEGGHQSR